MTRLERLKSFLDKEPEDAFLNYALAIELIGINQEKKALTLLEKLAQEQPNYTATYYHLAQLYLFFGLPKKAEETFEKGIKLTTQNGEVHQKNELQSAYNAFLYDE